MGNLEQIITNNASNYIYYLGNIVYNKNMPYITHMVLIGFIDLILVIPFFIVWIFTGRNFIFKLEDWIHNKTGIFEDLYIR